jgi:hypothetical protein
LAALPEKLREAILRAAASVPAALGANLFLDFAGQPSFSRLDSGAQFALIDALGKGQGVAAKEAAKLLPALEAISPRTRAALAAELAARPRDPSLWSGFRALIEAPGFTALGLSDQVDLLRFFAGPKLSPIVGPMRQSRIELWWRARRQELLAVTADRAFRSAQPAVQAELLRDHLHQRASNVWLLNATELNGHAVVIFGEPTDLRALSYGRRWVLSGGGKPVARLYSPDPTVASGWTKPTTDADTPYAAEKLVLSRHLVWMAIGWIEQAFSLTDDERLLGLGPRRCSASGGPFCETIKKAIDRLAKAPVRVERSYLRAGRPTRVGKAAAAPLLPSAGEQIAPAAVQAESAA